MRVRLLVAASRTMIDSRDDPMQFFPPFWRANVSRNAYQPWTLLYRAHRNGIRPIAFRDIAISEHECFDCRTRRITVIRVDAFVP